MLKSIQQDLAKQGMIGYPCSEFNLRNFASSVFRQSRVSYSVLLIALLYLLRFRHYFVMRRRPCSSSLPSAPHLLPIILISSLVLSTKFLHDRHSSNQVWATMTGVPTIDINRGELFFLNVIQHQLCVDQGAFQKWMSMLFQPKHLVPYQIIGNQMLQKNGREPSSYDIRDIHNVRPFIDSYKRPPEQVFMGYFPAM